MPLKVLVFALLCVTTAGCGKSDSNGSPAQSGPGSGGTAGATKEFTATTPDGATWTGTASLAVEERAAEPGPLAYARVDLSSGARGLSLQVTLSDPEQFLKGPVTLPFGGLKTAERSVFLDVSNDRTVETSWSQVNEGSVTLTLSRGHLTSEFFNVPVLGSFQAAGTASVYCFALLPGAGTGKAPTTATVVREDVNFESEFCQPFKQLLPP
jgi:hypothetical protein